MPLFEYNQVDRDYYEREIRDFIPQRIIDVHTHVYLEEFNDPAYTGRLANRSQSWPSLIAVDNSIEDIKETYKIMFPDNKVIPVIFGTPLKEYHREMQNDYIARASKAEGYPALLLTEPSQSADELSNVLSSGIYHGIKVYLEYAPAYIPGNEIRIFDYIPHHQLEILNENKMVLMLHIPRPGRLKDPVNIEQMLEIDRRYPDVKLIIAHVGRAYSLADLGDALDKLKDSNMMFDFSANTNHSVFEELLRTIDSSRIMFGSDLPVVRMRMKRVDEDGRYINIVKKGSYGNVSGDPHMREIEGAEADALSFFMYEIIASMRRACEKVGLPRPKSDAMFFDNAAKLFGIE